MLGTANPQRLGLARRLLAGGGSELRQPLWRQLTQQPLTQRRGFFGWFSKAEEKQPEPTQPEEAAPTGPAKRKSIPVDPEHQTEVAKCDERGWEMPSYEQARYVSDAKHHLPENLEETDNPFPWGMSDFSRIRASGKWYVDQTQFLPVLERLGPASMYLRPDHWGKTTLASMLRAYYDRNVEEEKWGQLFKGLHATGYPDLEHIAASDPELLPTLLSLSEGELQQILQRGHSEGELADATGSTLSPEQLQVFNKNDRAAMRPAISALARETSLSPGSLERESVADWLVYKDNLRQGVDHWIRGRAHSSTAQLGEAVPYLPQEASAIARTAEFRPGQASVTPDARQYAVLSIELGTQVEIPEEEKGLNPGRVKAAQMKLFSQLVRQGDEVIAHKLIREVREAQAAAPITIQELRMQFFDPINAACVEFARAYGLGVSSAAPSTEALEEGEAPPELPAYESLEARPNRPSFLVHPDDGLASLKNLLAAIRETYSLGEPLPFYVIADDFDSIGWTVAALYGESQPELFEEAVRLTRCVFDWLDSAAAELLTPETLSAVQEADTAFPFRCLLLGQSELFAPDSWKRSERNLQHRVDMLGLHRQHLSHAFDRLQEAGRLDWPVRLHLQSLFDSQFAGYEFLPSRRRDSLQLFQPQQAMYALAKLWQFGQPFARSLAELQVSARGRKILADELHDLSSNPPQFIFDWLIRHRRYENFLIEALTCRVASPLLVEAVDDMRCFTSDWTKQPIDLVLTLSNAFGFSSYENLTVPYLSIPTHVMRNQLLANMEYLTSAQMVEMDDFLSSGDPSHLRNALTSFTGTLVKRLQRSSSFFDRVRTYHYLPSLGARLWFLLSTTPRLQRQFTFVGSVGDFNGPDSGSTNFDIVEDIADLDRQTISRPHCGAQRSEIILWPDRKGGVVEGPRKHSWLGEDDEDAAPDPSNPNELVLRQDGAFSGPILVFQTLQLPAELVNMTGTKTSIQTYQKLHGKSWSIQELDQLPLNVNRQRDFNLEPVSPTMGKLLLALQPPITEWAAEARESASPYVVWSVGPEAINAEVM